MDTQPGVCILAFLGAELDTQANASGFGDRDISPRSLRLRVVVLQAREDLETAREVRRLVGDAHTPPMTGDG